MARKSKSKLDYFQAFKKQAEYAVKEADLLIEVKMKDELEQIKEQVLNAL